MASNSRENFTYSYYEDFVCRMREAYHLITFQEGKSIVDKARRPLLILRHDIDLELESALTLALMERDLEISATYFFMVSCPLYNVFSGNGAEKVSQILAAGHHFGLHFDCAIYPDLSVNNIDYYVSRECQLLEGFFGHPIKAVSFHRPGSLELSGVTLAKLPNSYEMVFREEFEYFSDSRGNWARGNPLESREFATRKNLHILTHPLWWNVEPKTPLECLTDFIHRMVDRNEAYVYSVGGIRG